MAGGSKCPPPLPNGVRVLTLPIKQLILKTPSLAQILSPVLKMSRIAINKSKPLSKLSKTANPNQNWEKFNKIVSA